MYNSANIRIGFPGIGATSTAIVLLAQPYLVTVHKSYEDCH